MRALVVALALAAAWSASPSAVDAAAIDAAAIDAAAGVVAGAANGTSAAGPVVRTRGGLVRGVPGEVAAFKGIPYAAPPVGAGRWRAPRPPARWTGVRDATRFGADCIQAPWIVSSGLPTSEDCLTVNVWTPQPAARARLPVLVFVYGGAFIGGTGGYAIYDGARLARDGAVVVSFNYRLGILGFLAHPGLSAESPQHASGNYGLLDQLAALRWVRANVAAFGGDPHRVTVFGESAGAASIAVLLASPLARGLFDGAIVQSPTLPPLADLASAERAGAAVEPDLARLRAMPAEELLKHNVDFVPAVGRELLFRFPAPIVDGHVLREQPRAAYRAGRVLRVPLIVGVNGDEGRMFAPPQPPTAAQYEAWVREKFGADAPAVLRVAPAGSDAQAPAALSAVLGDWAFNEGARAIARGAARHEPRTWSYVFTHAPGGAGLTATHSEELPYVFGSFDAPQFTPVAPANAADRALSDTIRRTWIRFARTGDPNGGGLPPWPSARGAGDPYLAIGEPGGAATGFRKAALDEVERILEADARAR